MRDSVHTFWRRAASALIPSETSRIPSITASEIQSRASFPPPMSRRSPSTTYEAGVSGCSTRKKPGVVSTG